MSKDKDAITRHHLASKVAEASDLTVKVASDVVDQIVDQITASITKDTDVMISGFGKFVAQNKKPRMGRNPRTGEAVPIEARKVMKFHPAPGLRELVSQSILPGKS